VIVTLTRTGGSSGLPTMLLFPRIVRWIYEIDILGAYTMKLDDGFFASPGKVLSLGLDDCGAAGG
jgi:hypothetical protein